MTFDEYYEKKSQNNTSRVKRPDSLDNSETEPKGENIIYVTIDDQTYWFTKQEIILTSIVLILSIILGVLIIKKIINKRSIKHKNVNYNKNKRCIIYISFFIVVALLIFIYFPNLFFDFIITAIVYEIVPLFLIFILKKKYSKIEAKKIAIFNSVIVFILFKLFYYILFGIFTRSYEFIFWGYISYKVLSICDDHEKEIE